MMRTVKVTLCFCCALLLGGTLAAQTTAPVANPPAAAPAQTGSSAQAASPAQAANPAVPAPAASATQTAAATLPNHPLALPRGFQDILLGLPMPEVKKLLEKNPYFAYRGDPDVSLAPVDKQPIIETAGVHFVSSGIFQFHNNALYTITIALNPQILDFYTMFTTLSNKYGDPTSLSPDEVVWENDQVRLSLEKPLTIKYIDRVVFNQIRDAGKAQQSLQQLSRQDFVQLF